MAYTWRASYETILFDTPDGMLGLDQYALAGLNRLKEQVYWLRIPQAAKSQGKIVGDLFSTTNANLIKGKTIVQAIGTAVRDEYADDAGNEVLDIGSRAKLDRLRTVVNEPLPSKAQQVGAEGR